MLSVEISNLLLSYLLQNSYQSLVSLVILTFWSRFVTSFLRYLTWLFFIWQKTWLFASPRIGEWTIRGFENSDRSHINTCQGGRNRRGVKWFICHQVLLLKPKRGVCSYRFVKVPSIEPIYYCAQIRHCMSLRNIFRFNNDSQWWKY